MIEKKETQMNVERFIKKNAQLFSNMTYDAKRMGWDFSTWNTSLKTVSGVYFIVKNIKGKLDILKVGKAEGVHVSKGCPQGGFYGRFRAYRRSGWKQVNTVHGRDVQFNNKAWRDIEKRYGKNCSLEMYTFQVEKTVIHKYGFALEASYIRSLELELSKKAKGQGHSMLLCGQD